ncbi:MAG TPA: hypothetical protein VJ608_00750, partial [Albitalea sp.]|nr:hypothetical protein [Albitalea sp.]
MTETMSLSYLFAHPAAVSLSVRHPAVLLALLVIPVFLVLAHHGTRRHRWALVCRGGAYALVVLALAGVALSARLPSDRLSVVVAVDRSESIDAPGRQWQQRYLDQVAAALAPGD